MNDHGNYVRSDARPFDCPHCDKVCKHYHTDKMQLTFLYLLLLSPQDFKNKRGLQVHVKRYHSSDSSFHECPQCDKVLN